MHEFNIFTDLLLRICHFYLVIDLLIFILLVFTGLILAKKTAIKSERMPRNKRGSVKGFSLD